MLTSAPNETGTFRKKVNVLFERMTSSDHAWYKQQKVFAEAYLQSYITKYKLDGRKFEPEKPDVYARSLNTPMAYHDWIQNISSALLDACLSIDSNYPVEVPIRLETHAPGIRHASQYKRGLAFDYNPNNKD